jgi:dienelactone hydrolase
VALIRVRGLVLLLALVLALPAAAQNGAILVEEVELPLVTAEGRFKLVATVLRPAGDARRPAIVLNHGAWGPAERRRSEARLSFEPASRWFAERGFAVIVPMRRGYGASEGEFAEGSGGCSEPDYARAGLTTAEDILAATRWMQGRAYVDARRVVLVGYSAGGWGALAAASRVPEGVVALINVSGGRGGFSGNGWPCVWTRMLDAAERFATTAPLPTLWIYAENDALFGADFAQKLAGAWRVGGGNVEFHALPPALPDGHGLFLVPAGLPLWTGPVAAFLSRVVP